MLYKTYDARLNILLGNYIHNENIIIEINTSHYNQYINPLNKSYKCNRLLYMREKLFFPNFLNDQ